MKWLTALVFVSVLPAQVMTGLHKDGNTVRFTLSGGSAELEWLNAYSFRFYRQWGGVAEKSPALAQEAVSYTIEASEGRRLIRTSEVTVEVDPAEFRVRVMDRSRNLWLTEWESSSPAALRRALLPNERIYGIAARDHASLDARGQKIAGATSPFYVSSRGYGAALTGGPHDFDLTQELAVKLHSAKELEYVFYVGPRLKDVFERHLQIAPQGWFLARDHAHSLNRLRKPIYANEVPLSLPQLLHASMAGNLIPAADCLKHFEPWCVFLPVILADERAEPMRLKMEPYLMAYFQEAKDRGYPVLRPLALQQPTDPDLVAVTHEYMLGDELLIAPLPPAANRRRVRLPRGQWTDLRTNQRYAGRQVIEIEGPASNPPVFAHNGSIVPFRMTKDLYELHYFPRLGGEFFLYEVEERQWSQVHAAPSTDFLRLESESKAAREYEWVIHHVSKPAAVESEVKVTWRYDEKLRNLHVKLKAAAGGDEIINITLSEPL